MLGRTRQRIAIAAILLMTFLATGCARVEPVKCFPVMGRVLVNGQPAAYARVVFHPLQERPSTAPLPCATTDADGQYQLTTDRRNDGAPMGEYAITIEMREPVTHGAQVVRTGRNTLPSKFAKPETSELRALIAPGFNIVPDIVVPG